MNTPSIRDKERDRDRLMRGGYTLQQASIAAGLNSAGVEYKANEKAKAKAKARRR